MNKPTFLLVHGACHGPFCWEALKPPLVDAGHAVVSIALPSVAGDGSHLGDLYEDARVVRDAAVACEEAVVVCHSYGGAPATHGLAGAANVRRIVYLAAFMLAEGEALHDVAEDDEQEWVVSEDGSTIVAADPASLFYGHCEPSVVASVLPLLRPQALASFTQPVLNAAWREIPSSYVVCDEDRAIAPHLQRWMAQRAGTVHTMFSDHSPFLSHPRETAALLLSLAA